MRGDQNLLEFQRVDHALAGDVDEVEYHCNGRAGADCDVGDIDA